MESKALGEWVEMVFQCEATARGIVVSKPFGDNQAYDFIIDSGHTLLRVQVKGVATVNENKNRYKVVFKRGNGASARSSYGREVDLFAVYVVDWNDWFIIPGTEIHEKRSVMYFYPKGSFASSSQYRNDWEIINYYDRRNQIKHDI
jgi:hypothetical protein